MTALPVPEGLREGGRALWKGIAGAHELDPVQAVQLHEACRAKDRLDKLDAVLSGESETWMTLVHDLRTEDYELKIDAALAASNSTANLMKQLLASLRLADASGQRPQQRGGARGAYKPTAAAPAGGAPAGTGTVSSLERARAAKAGA